MPKVGLTDIQREYEKEFKKYEERLSRVEEQGYTVKHKKSKLNVPKRKSIEQLKELNVKEIKESKGTTFTFTTPEGIQKTVSGKEGAKIQRSEAAKKGWETRRKKAPPKESVGEILWNELYDIATENSEHPSLRIRKNSARLISILNRHRDEDSFRVLEQLNREELLSMAREAMHYNPKDNSSQNMALIELEILLSEKAMSMAEIQKREEEEDEEEWESIDEEGIPF